jgi:hypothetical protein
MRNVAVGDGRRVRLLAWLPGVGSSLRVLAFERRWCHPERSEGPTVTRSDSRFFVAALLGMTLSRAPPPAARRASPAARRRLLRPRRNRNESLRRHSLGLGLEVHDDAVAENWNGHRVHVVEIWYGAAVHRGAGLGAED